MAAVSRILTPRPVSVVTAFVVLSMARRSALRAWSRAWRAWVDGGHPAVLGSAGRGTGPIEASSAWNHRAHGFAYPGQGLVNGAAQAVGPKRSLLELDRPAPIFLPPQADAL